MNLRRSIVTAPFLTALLAILAYGNPSLAAAPRPFSSSDSHTLALPETDAGGAAASAADKAQKEKVFAASAAKRDPELWPAGYYDGDPLPELTAYLTFDDGPSDFTDNFLNILSAYGAKATFFVIARWSPETWYPGKTNYELHPESLRRIVAEGHAIGNHTANHQKPGELSAARLDRELSLNRALVEWELGDVDGTGMELFRPPFGSPWRSSYSEAERRSVSSLLAGRRSVIAMWTERGDTLDSASFVQGEWYTRAKTDFSSAALRAKADRMVERIKAAADGRGLVVLMHDTHPASLLALPRIIVALKARGYRFATMEEWAAWKRGAASGEAR